LIALMLGVYFTPRLVGYALFLPWHEPSQMTKRSLDETKYIANAATSGAARCLSYKGAHRQSRRIELSGTQRCLRRNLVANYDENSTRGRQLFRLLLLAALALLIPRAATAQATAYYTLYSFKGDPDGAQPRGGVVIGKAGALYGTTFIGGTSGLGTIFELTPTTGVPWKETVLHNFNGADGEYPASALVFGGTGALYGATGGGGGGAGAIFELVPPSVSGGAWTETVLYAFGGGQNVYPNGGILIGPGGTLYATTQGSAVGGVGPNLDW
jgi:uncharacterized repeat protein (TIGR03803 family)